MAKAFPRALADAGFSVEPYSAHFGERNVPDEEWIGFTAERGWIGLTRDKRIRYTQPDTVMQAGARLIILKSKLGNPEFARALSQHRRYVTAFIGRAGLRFIASFKANARPDGSFSPSIEMWLSAQVWENTRKTKDDRDANR